MTVENQRKIQLAIIMIANFLPFAGVALWQWNAFQIIFLFWLESFIVGFYTMLELWTFDDSSDLYLWTNTTTSNNVIVFIFFYFGILACYLVWINQVLTGDPTKHLFLALYPFRWYIAFYSASFLIGHGIRFRAFLQRSEEVDLSALKCFFSPFLRFVVVNTLLLTSVFWIYYRHAAVIYFTATCIIKIAADYGFYRWHEAHIPAVIKDRKFFRL